MKEKAVLCTTFKREFRFELRSNSNNLDGLACAVSRHDHARGVMFDPVTETCIDLNDAWFSSPSYNPQLDYFLLDSVNKPSETNDSFKIDFPSNFVIGGSVILCMTTKTVGTTEGYVIVFQNQAETILGFYMNMRENMDIIVYNTNKNGHWGGEEQKVNPFKKSNKVYKLEFEVTTTQVKTYIDDSLFQSYNHRTSIGNYQAVVFNSTISTIDQVQFTFPVPA